MKVLCRLNAELGAGMLEEIGVHSLCVPHRGSIRLPPRLHISAQAIQGSKIYPLEALPGP